MSKIAEFFSENIQNCKYFFCKFLANIDNFTKFGGLIRGLRGEVVNRTVNGSRKFDPLHAYTLFKKEKKIFYFFRTAATTKFKHYHRSRWCWHIGISCGACNCSACGAVDDQLLHAAVQFCHRCIV